MKLIHQFVYGGNVLVGVAYKNVISYVAENKL